ncbi:DUF4238 domain-containing protein [Streptosporangium sp. NPDC048865]|uniref:DUF4238 domain-containing protein n=1 Tax=Streptosporangium sp. NPDC048865 TaxID=3155766 RepID=UPI00342A4FA3
MGDPKLHHYVPQFYLRRFTDSTSRLWVWDRMNDRIFPTKPGSIAAESNFYLLSHLAELGGDPLMMERQFSDLEGQVSAITSQWVDWIREDAYDELLVPEVNREVVSRFLALQFFRTLDARSILSAYYRQATGTSMRTHEEVRELHAHLLWGSDIVPMLTARIASSAWIFGYNGTATPFITSDNPVTFRAGDNRMWLKGGIFSQGSYLVYPLAPEAILYCYPDESPWRDAGISRFDCHISPVEITEKMVESENSAQVFMASRFVISKRSAFDREREFAKTIGTDAYAPPGRSLFG